MPTIDHSLPLLRVRGLSKRYGDRVALQDASFELWPGEVMAVVGESGSGKTTLLNAIAARAQPDLGHVEFMNRQGQLQDVYAMSEAQQRLLARTDWGFVHQNAADGLRMDVSAGANVGERLSTVVLIKLAAADAPLRMTSFMTRVGSTTPAFSRFTSLSSSLLRS
jgi:putative phosphonate transport system ATP-binding protein